MRTAALSILTKAIIPSSLTLLILTAPTLWSADPLPKKSDAERSLCLLVGIEKEAYYKDNNASSNLLLQTESQLAALFLQNISHYAEQFNVRLARVVAQSSRANVAHQTPDCQNYSTVLSLTIGASTAESGVAYAIYKLSDRGKIHLLKNKSYRPYKFGVEMFQSPFGGALDDIDERAKEIVELMG